MLDFTADLDKFALAWVSSTQDVRYLCAYGIEEDLRARLPRMQERHDFGECPDKCLAVLMRFDLKLDEWVRHDTIALENS